jgi:uncharacterized protein YxjI
MHSAFQHNKYFLKRQAIALTGKFRIYNPNGQMVLFSQQKMFKLKEDIRVFADETMTQEVLLIQARQIIDFSAAYDVIDPGYNQKVGVLRRKGFRSIMRDEWEILDSFDQPIGILQEDSPTRAMLRRLLLGSLLPQDYDVFVQSQQVADIRQNFNLFRYELNLDFSMDLGNLLDHRLGIAAGILLASIEGRQKS